MDYCLLSRVLMDAILKARDSILANAITSHATFLLLIFYQVTLHYWAPFFYKYTLHYITWGHFLSLQLHYITWRHFSTNTSYITLFGAIFYH